MILVYLACTLLLAGYLHPANADLGSLKDTAEYGHNQSELPDNWDQTKDDTQSLFLNKSDKNDLEPYPMALSEDGPQDSTGFDRSINTNVYQDTKSMKDDMDGTALDNIIVRPDLYGEPPALRSYGQLYGGLNRRKRNKGSNHKLEDIKAMKATKNTKSNGKRDKTLEMKRSDMSRLKRDSTMNPADILTLLSLWEAQERQRAEQQHRAAPENIFNYQLPIDDQNIPNDNSDSWYGEPIEQYPLHPSYFSEQNQLAYNTPRVSYPGLYQVNPGLLQRVEGNRRKRQWVGFTSGRYSKRFMVAKKRSGAADLMYQRNYRPREDLYSLSELLKSAPGPQEDIPFYQVVM